MSKKSTKNTKEFRQYSVGDHILGKIRGYPPWPGMVVDPISVPQAVLNEQPPGKKSTCHCVLFFPMGDYAWLHPKDLSSLKRHEIEAFLADEGKKRNADLREGYRIALDPSDWLATNEKRRQTAVQQEQEAQEQVDQLDSQSEEDGGASGGAGGKGKGQKKRKRGEDEEVSREKKTKSKKEAVGGGGGGVESKKKMTTTTTTGGGKSRKNGKSKSVVESEDDGEQADDDENAGPSKKAALSPPSKKVKRDRDDEADDAKSNDPQAIIVRDWRHKLQKTFLSHKTLPKPEAMTEIDQLFTTVENYNEMTIEQLQFSKIGKVMRHITAVPDERIPLDDEFRFRARAKSLVEKWHEILNANKQGGGGGESPTEMAGQLNGKSDEKVADEVTRGTKNLDLNGKDDSLITSGIVVGHDVLEGGDSSMLGEVTMSEA